LPELIGCIEEEEKKTGKKPYFIVKPWNGGHSL